jgi:hypothetical protein
MNAMITLTATVALGMVSVWLAWWMLGVLLAALCLILIGVIIANILQASV